MQIQSVDLAADSLRITWDNGESNQYHYLWLRDNCPTARHKIVGEKTLDPLSIALDVAPQSVDVVNGQLRIIWANDAHESNFNPAWLYANSYERAARNARHFRPTLWRADQIRQSLPELTYAAVMGNDEALLAWLQLLRQIGFTIIRQVPTERETVLKLAERINFLRNSNFGVLFNVESKPDPNSLAYTAVKLNAHTDLVSREAQPGLQFLHCLVFDAEGGDSLLVDGFAVAEELKQQQPEDYALLTTTPVRFHYRDKATDVNAKFPLIRLDADGNYFEIRYSTALLAPLDIDPEQVVPFYRAYQNFSRLLRDARFEFKFRLQAGDCEVFDNRRVLHGRDAFNPQSGPRHLQGCYIDSDDALSRLHVLERNGGDFRKSLSVEKD